MLHTNLIAPIPELLKRHAGERGGKVAYRDANASVTYAQLEERTGRLAAHLADHGIAAGDTVAMLGENRIFLAFHWPTDFQNAQVLLELVRSLRGTKHYRDCRLLKGEPGAAVRGYIEQLVAEGMLLRASEPYPVLRLTSAGALLLKGSGTCVLYREVQPPKPKKRARDRAGEPVAPGGDSALFDALRALRLEIARQRGVPPYVIFHDTTLRQMTDRRPQTLADLHEIYGIGARKAADFGDAFLDAIRTFRRPD